MEAKILNVLETLMVCWGYGKERSWEREYCKKRSKIIGLSPCDGSMKLKRSLGKTLLEGLRCHLFIEKNWEEKSNSYYYTKN